MDDRSIQPNLYIPRAAEFDRLVAELVDQLAFGPVAITTALPGGLGFGKTSLARAVVDDPRVRSAFPDGIFWVSLAPATGQAVQRLSRLELLRRIDRLITELTGKPTGLTSLSAAEERLKEIIHPLSVLLVLDDAVDAETMQPFLQTGPTGATLIVALDDACLPFGARRVVVDGMLPGEAEQLLAAGLLERPEDRSPTGPLSSEGAAGSAPEHWENLAGPLEEMERELAESPAEPDESASMKDTAPLAAQRKRPEIPIPPEASGPLLNLAIRLGEWPLLLSLANGLLVGLLLEGEEQTSAPPVPAQLLVEAVKQVNEVFTAVGLEESWKLSASQEVREEVLDLVISAALEAFSAADQERFCALVVFPPDTNIPLQAVRVFWGASPTPDAAPADALLARLAAHRLLEVDWQAGYIRLHRALHASLYQQLNDEVLSALNQRLVENYRALAPTGWAALPADGYIHHYLAGHLLAAGQRDDLQDLLFDFQWLSAFLTCTSRENCKPGDLYALLQQYDIALSTSLDRQSASLRLVREAINLSIPILAVNPDQLAAQLLGRLLVFEDPQIRKLTGQAAEWNKRSWLRPLAACFTPPGASEVRKLEGHTGWVTCVAILPDERYAVSGSLDGTLRIWDLSIGQNVREISHEKVAVTCLSVTPDGRLAVSGGMDGKIHVWDLATGQSKLTIKAHKEPVGALVITPDGQHILSGSDDKTIRYWELISGERVHEYTGHTDPVRALTITPDGRTLISGGWDNTVRFWDLENGQLLHTMNGHAGWVRGLAVTPNGYHAVSAGWDRTVRVWDLWTAEELLKIDHFDAPVFSLAVASDHNTIVAGVGDGTLRLLDFETGEEKLVLGGHTGGINGVAITHGGRFAITAADDCTLRIWDLVAMQGQSGVRAGRGQPGHDGQITAIEHLPGGRYIMTGSLDGTIKIWDVHSVQEVASLTGHAGGVTALAMDAAGRLAISGSRDRTVRVWDVEQRSVLRVLPGHDSPVTAVGITPVGGLGVSGAEDGTIKVWDLQSGDCLAVFHGESDVRTCRISPDGQTVIASDSAGKMFFLEIKRNR